MRSLVPFKLTSAASHDDGSAMLTDCSLATLASSAANTSSVSELLGSRVCLLVATGNASSAVGLETSSVSELCCVSSPLLAVRLTASGAGGCGGAMLGRGRLLERLLRCAAVPVTCSADERR